MPESTIPNPTGVFLPPASFLTQKDSNGNQLVFPRVSAIYPCVLGDSASLPLIFDAVGFAAATAALPLSIEELDVSDAFAAAVFAGVTLQACPSANSQIQIVVYGPAIVNISTDAPAFGDVAIKHGATDGCLITAGTFGGTWDATDVAGNGLAAFLSAEIGTTNTALVMVGNRF